MSDGGTPTMGVLHGRIVRGAPYREGKRRGGWASRGAYKFFDACK